MIPIVIGTLLLAVTLFLTCAEAKFRDSFEFSSIAKLTIVSNYVLSFKDTGNSMKRRLRTVPFLYQPAEVDAELEDALLEEGAGILRLLIREAGMYLASPGPKAFPVCPAIEAASLEYIGNQDIVGLFLADRVAEGNDWEEVSAGDMYAAYKAWCEANGYKATNTNRFGRDLKAHGLEKTLRRDGTFYLKIKLR